MGMVVFTYVICNVFHTQHSKITYYIIKSIYILVGHRLATKVFTGKLLATRGVWVICRVG